MEGKYAKKFAISASLRFKPIEANKNEFEIEQSLLTPFSSLLDPHYSQLKCYNDTCGDTVNKFHKGYNCTLFVYGQTGTGKTHTLFGPPNAFHCKSLEGGNANEIFKGVAIPSKWGIFPRLVLHLLSVNGANKSAVTATAVEIYMDNCYDLIRDKQKIAVAGYGRSSKTSGRGAFLETCQVKRDSSGKWVPPSTTVVRPKPEGYEMRGAKSTVISEVQDLLNFMCVVEVTRTSKSHKLNERSSRSHCVITLTMPSLSSSKYMLVDLAGSERIIKSGTIKEFTKAAEARNINTSLTSLGRCITALSRGNTFVPYRDSVLTMLLKQSLGGKCFTSVVITGTKDEDMSSETMASIQFGKRCAKVSNKKQMAQKMNIDKVKEKLWAELHEVDEEISVMTNSGVAGGLNPEFPKSLQQSFAANIEKYQAHHAAVRNYKQQIKAGEKSVDKKLKFEESQTRNLQGILLRSMTTGVWKDPCAAYIKKMRERTDIISSLKGMGENMGSVASMEIPITFDNLLLGYEG